MNNQRRLSCAIYTRKSTEEGLEQNFNTLDAQRDACMNYIASQKPEGWIALQDHYDDGGFSGGNMNRPGLQKLLDDVRNGLVDIIVVYKIDRLSRSLADFAKLVELFDENKVTFVSVTQSFNTTTSMGRLTLNILLSFAQFEREVSGERVRDKIAASRKRGIWMGGMPALGYDVKDRKLVPNPQESKIVQEIFDRYASVPSVATLMRDLQQRGITSKAWTTSKGVTREGKLMTKGYLYKILRNPVYIGIAAYKGKEYPGEHAPIITQTLWDHVQAQLTSSAVRPRGTHSRTSQAPTLLRGLLFSGTSKAFTPTWSKKGPRYYRYYINVDAIKIGKEACDIVRLPAGEIEQLVLERVRMVLRTPEIIAHALREIEIRRPGTDMDHAVRLLQQVDPVWDELFPAQQEEILRILIDRITVSKDGIDIAWKTNGMHKLLKNTLAADFPQELA